MLAENRIIPSILKRLRENEGYSMFKFFKVITQKSQEIYYQGVRTPRSWRAFFPLAKYSMGLIQVGTFASEVSAQTWELASFNVRSTHYYLELYGNWMTTHAGDDFITALKYSFANNPCGINVSWSENALVWRKIWGFVKTWGDMDNHISLIFDPRNDTCKYHLSICKWVEKCVTNETDYLLRAFHIDFANLGDMSSSEEDISNSSSLAEDRDNEVITFLQCFTVGIGIFSLLLVFINYLCDINQRLQNPNDDDRQPDTCRHVMGC